MKKKVNKKTVKKTTTPKVAIVKPTKSVVKNKKTKSVKWVKENPKKPQKIATTDDGLIAKNAVCDLRKLYRKLDELNTKKAEILSDIAKQEARIGEVLDLNMAKVEDRSSEELLKKLSKPAQTVTSPTVTDLLARTTSDPFAPKAGIPQPADILNAVACRY